MRVDSYATHQPVLCLAILSCSGPLLELGGGFYSTPLLSVFAHAHQRASYTLENNEFIYNRIKPFENEFHKIRFVEGFQYDNRGMFLPDKTLGPKGYYSRQATALQQMSDLHSDWGVVLVDQSPGFLRTQALEYFSDKADLVVIHDSEHVGHYRLAEALSLYKFRYDFTFYRPNTTVLSNRMPCSFNGIPAGPIYTPILKKPGASTQGQIGSI